MGDSKGPSVEELLTHVGWVRRLARRLARDAFEADDLVQDAFVAALTGPPDRGGDLRSWLGTVLGNRLRMRRRAEGRRAAHELEAGRPAEVASYDADLVEQLERQRQLARLVETLPPAYRRALLARYYHGELPAETARRLGIRPATLRSQLARGLKLLRARLEHAEGGRSRARAVLLCAAGSADGGFWTGSTLAGGLKAWASLKLAAGAILVVGGAALWARSAPLVFERAVVPERPHGAAGQRSSASGQADPVRDITRRPVEAPAAGAGPTGLRLLAAENRAPLGDGVVFVLPPGGGVREREVDPSGELDLPPADLGSPLAAWAPGRLPVRIAAPQPGSLQPVPLVAGGLLSGRVLSVGGGPPPPGACLNLVPQDSSLMGSWPPALRERLVARVPGLARGPLSTDAHGRFLLRGLPPDWAARVWAGEGYRIHACEPDLTTGSESAWIPQPIRGLRLTVDEAPVLQGVVLWSDSREPVAEGTVAARILYTDGGKSMVLRRRLTSDGRFSVGASRRTSSWGPVEVQRVRIEVHPEGGAECSVALDAWPVATETLEITVQRVPDVHLLVSDEAGRPIEGALVAGHLPRDYGVYRKHAHTDSQGRVRLPNLPLGAPAVTVGAPGHGVVSVAVASDRGQPGRPVDVRLSRTNELRIDVVPEGIPPGLLTVHLLHEGPLLEAEVEGNAIRRRFLQLLGNGNTGEPGVYRNGLSGEGPWCLTGLLPDRPLRIEVREAKGAVLLRRSFVGPGRGEIQAVSIPVAGEVVSLRGKVLGPDGEGLARVGILLDLEGAEPNWLTATEPGGEFEGRVVRVPGRVLRGVVVKHRGFASRYVELGSPDCSEVDLGALVLGPSDPLEVVVREPGGRRLVPDRIWASVDGRFEIRGSSRLLGLAPGPVRVNIELGGRRYSRECLHPANPQIFGVPAHGILWLERDGVDPDDDGTDAEMCRLTRLLDPSFELLMRSDQPSVHALLPGEYRLDLGSRRVVVEVRAGETRRVSLGALGER